MERFRDRALVWLLGLDTRLSEFGLGCSAIINGVQVLSLGRDGHSLAPFLSSAFRWLSFDAPLWVGALAIVGVVRLFCLGLGMARNNAYLPRGIISLVDAGLWTAVVAAILTGPEPPVVAARYSIAALLSYVVALVLWLRHDVKEKDKSG